jgi:hypothetical protein
MSKQESIAVILREAKEASEALLRQRPGTLEEMKAQGLRTKREPHDSSEAGTPAPKARKYTPQQLREKLLGLGVRDATLKPGGPTAFELSGFPNSSHHATDQ